MGEGSATEVYFYHLERRTLADVLPTLLELSLKRGWRAVVQAASEERVEALDTLLWTYGEESFLPHGTARDGRASAQPVYLTADEDNPNAAHVRFLVDGATLADASPYVRVAYVFDGRDQDAVARAREAWRGAKAQGYAVSYFQQDTNGSWREQG
ncbi:MAG: DNA polymerase III subunit chi [Methyloceanibacter sp.]